MEGQPISVEALERPVEENRPQPNPVEGDGKGPMFRFFGKFDFEGEIIKKRKKKEILNFDIFKIQKIRDSSFIAV